MTRLFCRVVCWMILRRLHGQNIALQRNGVDFDVGQATHVYPVRSAEGIRFVVSVSCLHPVSDKLGFTILRRDFEYPSMRWDSSREQFVVPNCDV